MRLSIYSNFAALLFSLGRRLTKYTRHFVSKRSLARLLSTLLCSIIVVIRPFSRLGGRSPFLVLDLKELVFSAQENLAQQLEITVLNIMGALLGIGISTLAKFGASRYPFESLEGRVICAMTLVAVSFFAGLIKSRLPRLQLSTRISCFVSVWILTSNIGIPSSVLPDGGAFVWMALSAAIIGLFSVIVVMLPFRWASTSFEHDITSSFSLLHHCLSIALASYSSESPPTRVDRDDYHALQSELLSRSIKLNESYSQAAFELRKGHLSLRSIRPLIGTVERLRRELAWGVPLKHIPRMNNLEGEQPFLDEVALTDVFNSTIASATVSLGHAILTTMRCVETTISLAFHQNDSTPYFRSMFRSSKGRGESTHEEEAWTARQLTAIESAHGQLTAARDSARETLDRLYGDHQVGGTLMGEEQPSQGAYDASLAMVALFHMAEEMLISLLVAERLVRLSMESHPRLWYPRISLAWFGVVPGPFISDDPSAKLSAHLTVDDGINNADTSLCDSERRQGLAEQAVRFSTEIPSSIHTTDRNGLKWTANTVWSRLTSFMQWLWVNERSMLLRLKLWRLHKTIHKSDHLRHALKCAVGVGLLSFPAFMGHRSAGYRWYSEWHGQWMTISYLWVLETNTGATWRIGYLRILGTCIGAFYAFVSWAICRRNPYGLVILLTLADVPITWLILRAGLSPLAGPWFVALPPIMFSEYFSPGAHSVAVLALLRALMITAGMVAALLVNSLVFPRHCRVLFLSDTSRTLGLLSSLYMSLSHETFHPRRSLDRDDRRKTIKLELEIRSSLHRLSTLIISMKNEFGLLPKPLKQYRQVIVGMQKTLDLLSGLRKIRGNIPQQETVSEVFKERRAFMSCVCIALFACQHVFRTREPLPQFLPSARHAHSVLESQVYSSLRRARRENSRPLGISLGHAFAEQETLRNVVDALEALLELSGRLFGTAAWLVPDSAWSASTTVDEGTHEWFSTWKLEEA